MNNEELVNNAIATFCGVPEVYQQIFKELGSDFPDELVASIKEKPEDAVKMVQKDEQLLNSICTIYSKYTDDINAAYEAASQKKTKMFEKGSKLEALVSKKPIAKKQEGGPIMVVYPDTFMGGLKNLFKGSTDLYDLPNEGITNRHIYAKVDPKTGRQRIFLSEVVRGDSADTQYIIDPEKRDTVIVQSYPQPGTQPDGNVEEHMIPGTPRYNALMNRLVNSGILNAIHSEFPKTKKFQNGGDFTKTSLTEILQKFKHS